MRIKADSQTAEAIKRLRLVDDFTKVIELLENLSAQADQRCVVASEESLLRQCQGRAQQLQEVVELLKLAGSAQ